MKRSIVGPLKVSLHKMFSNNKGKIRNFIVGKAGRHHRNQMSKVKITSKKTHGHSVNSDVMNSEGNVASVAFLPKTDNLKLILENWTGLAGLLSE